MKNKYNIGMICTESEYDKIYQELIALSYTDSGETYGNMIVNNYGNKKGNIGLASNTSCHNNTRIHFNKFDKDLFLAIASIYDDNEYHNGEWVIIKGPGNNLKLLETKLVQLYICDETKKPTGHTEPCQFMWKDNHGFYRTKILHIVRKATIEELIEHFNYNKSNISNMINNNFVLPAKWWIQSTLSTSEKIYAWLRENKQNYREYINLCITDQKSPICYPAYNGFHQVKGDETYKEITFEQFEKYVLKNNNMKEFKITRTQLQEIHNIACTAWKSRINKLTIDTLGAFENEGILSETTVKEMFTAADSSQKEVLTRIFPDYGKINIPDKAPVLAWNDNDDIIFGFYDLQNNCLFQPDGDRLACRYDNYEIFKGELPEIMKERQKLLKD